MEVHFYDGNYSVLLRETKQEGEESPQKIEMSLMNDTMNLSGIHTVSVTSVESEKGVMKIITNRKE